MYLTFGNYSNSVAETLNIEIQNQKIRRVMAYKYLGIHFDYNMRWDKHIEYVYSKTKYLILVLYKLKKIMDTNTLMTMYYAFFHSFINYGIIAWGGAYKTRLDLLQRTQDRLLKIIYKNKFYNKRIPLNLNESFILESLVYHYNTLKDDFKKIERNTRHKLLQLPKNYKSISEKNSYLIAMKAFN